MPRKPTRHPRLLPVQPLTFSPFARSVARVATAYLVKHHMHDATLQSADRQSESSEDETFDGVVQADFAFFDPKPDDFHGVKTLLQSYLDNKQWDLSGFIDLILGQTTVGTVVKLEDDEDNGVFSIITALNLGRYKDHKCITELKEFLLNICQEKDKIGNLRSLLEDKAQNVGLLVSQRVLNLLPELLPHLYDALFDEVSWATEDEPTEELCNSFCFKFYVLVSKIYKLSMWSFLFLCKLSRSQLMRLLKNYQLTGIVIVVEAENVSSFRQRLLTLINES
ncbi:hypothetical protein CRYUN_Cryun21dG0107300 [Craigia yunnanensis]